MSRLTASIGLSVVPIGRMSSQDFQIKTRDLGPILSRVDASGCVVQSIAK